MGSPVTADRGPGRPTTGTRIEVRVPGWVLTLIDGRAAAEAKTRAEVVREMLEERVLARN